MSSEEMTTGDMALPGFRFHPTEEELLDFYLKNTILGNKPRFDIIGFLNIYHHDPWDLPGLAKVGEREWYFFVPRDKKHGSGGRPNRTTQKGFWKATGSDRKIISLSDPKRVIGLRKTLVFYRGRAPRGTKTDWVMNEYRLADSCHLPNKDIVLCKIYRKATSLKVLEQRAAMEEEMKQNTNNVSPCSSSDTPTPTLLLKQEAPDDHDHDDDELVFHDQDHHKTTACLLRTNHKDNKIPDLQLPFLTSIDWNQDPFWTTQIINSPWLSGLSPTTLPNF